MKFEEPATPAHRQFGIRECIALASCALIFSVTIAAYAGLLPAGHWQDEYYTFYRFRDEGLPYLVDRVLTWSPRPLSETFVYLYSIAVVRTGRPLIGTILATAWIATALAVVALPIRYAPTRQRVLNGTVGLGLFALFLTNHPTGEMYYWPQASLAYLPALAAIGALFWLCAASGLESRRTRCAAAALLIVAACSIEVGAMLVFAIAGLSTATYVAVPHLRNDWRQSTWLAFPLVASGCVLALIAHGRVSNGAEVMGDPAIAHHARPVLHATIVEFAKAIAASNWDGRTRFDIVLTIISKACVFGAFFGLSTRLSNSNTRASSIRWLTILSLACAATTLLTIAAAYYQFGMLCCERHDTLRQCLIYLAIASAACAIGLAYRGRAIRGAALPLSMLGTAVVINLSLSVPALRSDYARYDTLRDIKVVNWNRGTASSSSMEFDQTVPGSIVGGVLIKEKSYTLADPKKGWWIEGVLKFFRKTEVTFVTK
ncbi:hypothetical protein [Burkholderia pseudomultivorans]|uniref:Glycosyltransferase RgtA/B/C/D-like domain-containing protein n=1 Tax=Burkholderia pseudomultivorans TaxID=1207504 RepID=A0A132EFV6_9BURK|nr:hypothetical protein [Burkholderia pseudomultivorans]KWF29277.1 hypothetical protein WT56_17335 [Burkholderia pseudomultivorans]